jgi:prepilin-type N-terminal cleavage/methylation domain-containing protein
MIDLINFCEQDFKMKLEKNRKKGFTLIEMLVIIGIIGILSGALITSMSHLKVTAKRARAQAAVSDAYTALNLDGYVDGSEGSPKGLKIRSNVLVWSRGPDGKDDSESSIRYPYDDLISWDHGKVKAEN